MKPQPSQKKKKKHWKKKYVRRVWKCLHYHPKSTSTFFKLFDDNTFHTQYLPGGPYNNIPRGGDKFNF